MKSKKKKVSGLYAKVLNGFAWFLASFVTFIYSSIGLLVVLPLSTFLDRDRRAMHVIARTWAKSLLAGHPLWSTSISGVRNLNRRRCYVVVANHQSIVDILVVLAALPLQFKFIAKKELFKLPWLGWHMWGSGYIPLDRSSKQSGRNAVEAAKDWLGRGVSVLFFPEGTRSEDGEIKAFKNGAFKIALEKKMPVLPVVLDGTGATSPKKSKTISHHAELEVQICKPVEIKEGETVETLSARTRELMREKLAEMRGL